MRIWHESLIPKLCRQHLLAMWREGLGCYSIIINKKKGYSNHPQVKEFEEAPLELWCILNKVRNEMLRRSYHPKEMPKQQFFPNLTVKDYKKSDNIVPPHPFNLKPWQSLKKQIEILKSKNCECKV